MRSDELTMRALLTGCAIGAVLAAGNVYMGLKTGWVDGGSITAAILSFALLGRGSKGARYSRRENNLSQATASAVAAMPSAAGLIGAIPALSLMGHEYPSWGLAAWGVALAVLGLLLSLPLRQRFLVEEQLPFPSGRATAEVISAMHTKETEGLSRARTLAISAAIAALWVWFRDGRPAWLPAVTALPFALAEPLTLGVSWSPLMFGTGLLVGPRLAASLLVGSVLAYGTLAPLALHLGAAEPNYASLRTWLTWPGVALMVSASLTDLVLDAKQIFARSRGGSWRASLVFDRSMVVLGIAGVLGVLFVGWEVFGISPLAALLALALATVLSVVCARAAGQTDVIPLGPMGQLAQVVLGAVTGGAAGANVVAGSLTAGQGAAAAQGCYAMKAGEPFEASPRRLFYAQLAGVLVGAVVSVPIYHLLVRVYGIGSEALPVPPAEVWRTLAEMVAGGAMTLPSGAGWAAGVAAVVGVVLTGLARTRLRHVPSAVAMGISFILPAYYAVAIAAGAFLTALVRRAKPGLVELHGDAVGAGAIAGESLMGVLVAVLVALGILTQG